MSDLNEVMRGLAKTFNLEAKDVTRVLERRKDASLQNIAGEDVWFRFYDQGLFTVHGNVNGARLKESFMFQGDGEVVSMDYYAFSASIQY